MIEPCGCHRAGRRVSPAARPQAVRPGFFSPQALLASACSIGAALAALSALLAARPLDGSLDLLRGEPGQLMIEERITLDPVRHSELAGGLTTTASSRRPAVALDRHRLLIEPAGLLFSLPSRRIAREVPALWRMELPPDVDPRGLMVSYELVASSGRRDRLSFPGEPDSEIRVRLRRFD